MINEAEKQVLGLKLPTDPRWVELASIDLKDILVDHAYCEQKAASSCISLIIQYPDKPEILAALTPVVREEWSHFEMVIRELNKRGYELGYPRKDEYVRQLNSLLKKGGSRDQQLVEKLLLNALIEARSCERFRLLSKNLNDSDLREFYRKLMISEAGHYRMFIDLAKNYAAEEVVMQRWREILKGEAEIMKSAEVRADRIH